MLKYSVTVTMPNVSVLKQRINSKGSNLKRQQHGNVRPLTDLLESLAQNGKPPDENGSAVNGGGPGLRHRGERDGANASQGPSESDKSYTAEQLEAVRK